MLIRSACALAYFVVLAKQRFYFLKPGGLNSVVASWLCGVGEWGFYKGMQAFF